MRRRLRAAVLAALMGVLLLGCAGGLSTDAHPTSPASSVAKPGTSERPLFLALGDSLTTGYDGERRVDDKARAYPALVAQRLASEGRPVTLVNLACSGEETSSFISGGRCFVSPSSQLAEAESALRHSAGNITVVTLWIGINDFECLAEGRLDEQCRAVAHRAQVANLPIILRRLRDAAGPEALILALTYFDPFRNVDDGAPDAALKRSSGPAISDLDVVIADAAREAHAVVVPTGPLMEGPDGKRLCQTTFVCARGDIHLSPDGQEVIRELVLTTTEGQE